MKEPENELVRKVRARELHRLAARADRLKHGARPVVLREDPYEELGLASSSHGALLIAKREMNRAAAIVPLPLDQLRVVEEEQRFVVYFGDEQ